MSEKVTMLQRGNLVFTPGNFPAEDFIKNHFVHEPYQAKFDAKFRPIMNETAHFLIAQIYADLSPRRKLTKSEKLVFGRLKQEPDHGEFDTPEVIDLLFQYDINPFLPAEQKIAELVAHLVTFPLRSATFETLNKLKSKGDLRYNLLRKLVEANKEIKELEEGVETSDAAFTAGQKTDLYIVAGINEGSIISMLVLRSIPSALQRYHKIKRLPQPSREDYFNFAKDAGLKWVRMHSSAYKDSFFEFIHMIVSREMNGSYLLAPPLKKDYLVIGEHPENHKPALAYDLSQMDDLEAMHINYIFSQTSAGPPTKCPALGTGMTEELYMRTLQTMQEAEVFGY